jgi:hypothetical protein
VTKLPRVVSDRHVPDTLIEYIGKDPKRGGYLITVTISEKSFKLVQDIISGKETGNWAFIPQTSTNLARRARIGDHEPLVRYFAEGGDLTPEERSLIAAIALGQLPKPQSCPPKIEKEVQAKDIARFAQVLTYMGGKRVADIAAAKFGVDRSYVTKLVKKHRGEAAPALFVQGLLVALGGSQDLGHAMMLRFAGITDADMKEATRKRKRRN